MKTTLAALCLGLCVLAAGCGSKKTEQSQDIPFKNPAPTQETKTIASGEGQQGARVEFVTREHGMERITFSGGYLRSLPEEKPETIMRPAPTGSQGMIFGKREINGLEWAKVATRDGVTAWYAVPAREGAAKGEKRAPLQVTDSVYRSTYPQITGGVEPRVQDLINQELGNYFSVYRHVTGPVGGELQCQVTYNKNRLLSLVFSGKPIRYRSYPVSEVNNLPSWAQLKKYAHVSPLMGGADPNLLLADKTDFQYAMVFDLTTGSRLTLEYFIGHGREKELQDLLQPLGDGARLQRDNFYVDEKGSVTALVSVLEPDTGRVPLDLTGLKIRNY